MSEKREIVVGETEDGAEVRLPVVNLLTGRGFITGKSGSGKSNTASVVAEELLEAGYPLLVVDTDGEYYGLKEEYEMLHAGADEECDVQIGPEHAEQMASLALEENVPVILDVSGYLDEEVADELLRETARQLFVKEKKHKKPFLLVVEEVHEYIPEGGGVGETGKMLIKIGKRGRKHGLGIVGISQRPADVKKDFITQANWLVWHRLTWDNDTKVVGRIIDTEYSEWVSELDDGQAFLQTDWNDVDVRKIQWRRKRTFDAGATPGLDDFERPELKSVSDALVGDLQQISERKQREQDRIEELELEVQKREERIEQLEDELASARDVSDAARQMAEALSGTDTVQSTLPDRSDDLRRLHDEIVDLEEQRDDLRAELADLEERCEELEADRSALEAEREALAAELESAEETIERREQRVAFLESENETLRDRIAELEKRLEGDSTGDGIDDPPGSSDDEPTPIIEGDDDREFGFTDVEDVSADGSGTEDTVGNGEGGILVADEEREVSRLLEAPGVREPIEAACEDSRCSAATAERVVAALAGEGALRTDDVAEAVDRSPVAVQGLLSELRTRGVLDRTGERTYDLHQDVRAALAVPDDE